MKIEYEHNTRVVKIDGKDVATMAAEEKKNAIICGEDVNNVSTVEI